MGRSMDNDNVQSLDGYSSRIGEAVGWLKMSEEEKLEYIKDQIKHEEDKDFINKTVKAAEKAAEKDNRFNSKFEKEAVYSQ